MKTFTVTVKCADASSLAEGIAFAAQCVIEEPDRYSEMEVNESDEQLSDPDYIESFLVRTA